MATSSSPVVDLTLDDNGLEGLEVDNAQLQMQCEEERDVLYADTKTHFRDLSPWDLAEILQTLDYERNKLHVLKPKTKYDLQCGLYIATGICPSDPLPSWSYFHLLIFDTCIESTEI